MFWFNYLIIWIKLRGLCVCSFVNWIWIGFWVNFLKDCRCLWCRERGFVIWGLGCLKVIGGRFRDLICRGGWRMGNRVVGFVKRNKDLWFWYLGLLYRGIGLCRVRRVDLIGGGGSCFKSVGGIVCGGRWWWDRIIGWEGVSFGDRVGSCGWIKGWWIVGNRILIINGVVGDVFGFEVGFYGIFEVEVE